MIQKNLLKFLFVEDVPSDVDLAVRELRKEKFKFDYTTVCTKIDLVKALKEFKPDLIISDYTMPAFNGLQALKETKAYNPEIPFILYTVSLNEETAVECIKAGACDYVIKEHLKRLSFAVKEALDQVLKDKEKRASELLLKDNEEKLQSIFSATPIGIGLVVNRVMIEVNDSFCSMTGYTRRELIGKSSEIIYSSSEEFMSAGEYKYQQIAEKGTGSVETSFKCKDGKILNVILSSAPLDKNDHSKGVTFTVLDITDRKNVIEALKLAKEKAEISDRLKTEFLNNISHEVRTPLNGILGFAEIISMNNLSETEKKDSLKMLFESSNRLLNTISNYMDISLITSGSLSVNEKDFDPSLILKRIFNNFEHACLIRKLGLFLDNHENPNDYIIHSDPEICHKILSHFMDNAIKFTEKGSIHFGFSSNAEKLEFYVKDTGIGINQDSFNTIFDRFVKGNQGPYKVIEGSGLGLPIAQGMSEAIGGMIRLESEPGVGSCFFLTVPVKKGGESSLTGNNHNCLCNGRR